MIWIVVGLLLLRGVGAVLAPTHINPAPNAPDISGEQASSGFALSFVRAYLADPDQRVLAPFLAEGASVGTGTPPQAGVAALAQAEVIATERLGGGREILTVACDLRDARTLYLAVPIVRSEAGEVAALGAPSMVAAPGVAGADPERPQSLAGPDADLIRRLIAKFMPAYLAEGQAADLAYLMAPGTSVQPLGGAVRFDSLAAVAQLDSGEGPARTVLVAVRVDDTASAASYPLAYRVEVVKHGRWYVKAVQGALR